MKLPPLRASRDNKLSDKKARDRRRRLGPERFAHLKVNKAHYRDKVKPIAGYHIGSGAVLVKDEPRQNKTLSR